MVASTDRKQALSPTTATTQNIHSKTATRGTRLLESVLVACLPLLQSTMNRDAGGHVAVSPLLYVYMFICCYIYIIYMYIYIYV